MTKKELLELENQGLKIRKNDVEKSVKILNKAMKALRTRQKEAGDETR